MAVLEVFMVSGFYPDRFSLYDIPISIKGVRKWEEYEERIVFYFEDLKQKKVCVQFLVNQEVCVEKTNPGLIKLYDYYNSQQTTTVKYNLHPECNNGTGNWLNELAGEKLESRRDMIQNYYSDEGYNNSRTSGTHLADFVDLNFDLETPEENGPLPVYVPNTVNDTSQFNCPLCLGTVPKVFSNLYCSAERVIVVNKDKDDLLNIVFDLSPRRDAKTIERSVSFDINKNCTCETLERVGGAAIIVLTPLQSQRINSASKLRLDNAAVIIPVEHFKNEFPAFLTEAIDYCRTWSSLGQNV